MRVAVLVPTVRPRLLAPLLDSWERTPATVGLDLHVVAQRELASEFAAVVRPHLDRITRYEYRPEGGPVWPVRAGYVADHRDEADVWILLDDDMELLPDLTDWGPAIERVTTDPTVGVVSCNWARSQAMLSDRMPPEDPAEMWVRQPIVNMSGGMVFRSEVADLMAETRDTPWMFDDTMVGLVAYLDGLENWRYRGSVLIHRILTKGGVERVFRTVPLTPLDERYIRSRMSRSRVTYKEEAQGNNRNIPVSSDLTPLAREMHQRRRAERDSQRQV